MASTKLTNGGSTSGLNDKQRRFVAEYLIDYNGTRACIAAGYSQNSANTMATKLLKIPQIARAIGKAQAEDLVHLKLTKEEILKQLYYAATRSARDFCDDQGRIITDVSQLDDRACATIDGIDQKVETYVDADGVPHEVVTTKLKLTSKIAAIDLAMKHKGLFAPTKVEGEVKHTFDWGQLYGEEDTSDDPIQKRLQLEEEEGPCQVVETKAKPMSKKPIASKPRASK